MVSTDTIRPLDDSFVGSGMVQIILFPSYHTVSSRVGTMNVFTPVGCSTVTRAVSSSTSLTSPGRARRRSRPSTTGQQLVPSWAERLQNDLICMKTSAISNCVLSFEVLHVGAVF